MTVRLPHRLPKRPKRDNRVRCPGHLAWLRGFECACGLKPAADETTLCAGRTEAAHVRTGTDGGTGLKPSDSWAIPLCTKHHREQHASGETTFARRYGLDMKEVAQELARRSPALQRYRAKQKKDAAQ